MDIRKFLKRKIPDSDTDIVDDSLSTHSHRLRLGSDCQLTTVHPDPNDFILIDYDNDGNINHNSDPCGSDIHICEISDEELVCLRQTVEGNAVEESQNPSQTVISPIPHAPGPSDISFGKFDSPVQPIVKDFKITKYSGRERSFQSKWYQHFPWLEYSCQTDAAYCFACRHFSLPNGKNETTFTTLGYSNWKSAMEKDRGFKGHQNSQTHRMAKEAWLTFQSMKTVGGISDQLNSVRVKVIEENRSYIQK